MTLGPERRGDVRVRWRTRVVCTRADAGDVLEGESCDMSASGAVVCTDDRLALGEEVVVEVVSADPPLSMRRVGRVTRACRRDHGGFAYALRFEPGSPRSRAELLAALIFVASRSGQRAPADAA